MLASTMRALRAGLGIELARLQEAALDYTAAASLVRAAMLMLLAGTGVFAFGLHQSLRELLPAWQAGALVALVLALAAGLAFAASRVLVGAGMPAPSTRGRAARARDAPADLEAARRDAGRAGRAMRHVAEDLELRTSDLMLAALVAGVMAASVRPEGGRD